MTRVLVNASAVLTLDDDDTIHEPGIVGFEDGVLTVVESGRASGRDVLDLDGHVLMPGLVNCHTHTPMALLRGIAEGHSLLTLRGWFDTVRVLEQYLSSELAGAAVDVSLAEMTRTGTTCFADQYFYMDEVVPRVRRSGLRAALAHGIVELDDPLARDRELATARDLLVAVADDPLIDGWLGPHALLVDNSAETVAAEIELAREFNTGLHTHFATSGEEQKFCTDAYGRDAVATFEDLGVLDVPVLLAHGLEITADDYAVLARHDRATIVLAPTVCMASGANPPPVRDYLDAGVRCAIGTDNVCNNNSYDLFEEMRALSRMSSLTERRPAPVSSREILRMATRGGAAALGLDDRIGSLEVGKSADLLGLDTAQWRSGPAQSLHSATLFATSQPAVTQVAVAGEWLLRDGRLTHLDDRDARRELGPAFAVLEDRRARSRT